MLLIYILIKIIKLTTKPLKAQPIFFIFLCFIHIIL